MAATAVGRSCSRGTTSPGSPSISHGAAVAAVRRPTSPAPAGGRTASRADTAVAPKGPSASRAAAAIRRRSSVPPSAGRRPSGVSLVRSPSSRNRPRPSIAARRTDGAGSAAWRTKTSAFSRISATPSAWAVDSVPSGVKQAPSVPRSMDARPTPTRSSTIDARSGIAGSCAMANRNGRLAAAHRGTDPAADGRDVRACGSVEPVTPGPRIAPAARTGGPAMRGVGDDQPADSPACGLRTSVPTRTNSRMPSRIR